MKGIKDAMARQRRNDDPCARLESDHGRNREHRHEQLVDPCGVMAVG
jgi:hypothetical protein